MAAARWCVSPVAGHWRAKVPDSLHPAKSRLDYLFVTDPSRFALRLLASELIAVRISLDPVLRLRRRSLCPVSDWIPDADVAFARRTALTHP